MGARRALVAVVVVMLAAGAARAAVPRAEPRPAAAVALGDSFISGEGARGGYGASAVNGCHRSRTAPIRSAPIAGMKRVNLACSGARAENVWRAAMGGRGHRGEPPQADRLAVVARRYDVRLVVLTVGANDLGFARLVARCALRWAAAALLARPGCRDTVSKRLAASLPGAERALRKAIREVRGPYRLIVMGYASPLPPADAIRYPQRGWTRLTKGGCPLTDADADWAKREAVPAIMAMMRRAVASAGTEFLDVSAAFDGHEACSRHARPPPAPAAEAEWMRGLDLCCERSPRESLHPNRHGQRALGACIALAYAAPPGDHACHNTPGESYVTGMRLGP